jgi:hypothetical protein
VKNFIYQGVLLGCLFVTPLESSYAQTVDATVGTNPGGEQADAVEQQTAHPATDTKSAEHPRVFVTASELRDMVARINVPGSFSAQSGVREGKLPRGCDLGYRFNPSGNLICTKHATKSLRKVRKSSPWARHLIELKKVRRIALQPLTLCAKNRGSGERSAQVWHNLKTGYLQLFEIGSTNT